ncbi:MAG: DUF4198 domain-containing protein [Gammaproteobacteria bacterium]|nr:DUF4198 domain-containing protein [Gammaproteobacteria bacterium]
MKIHKLALGAVALLMIGQASAHNRWILPSHFNLSNDKGEWVMVDVTASNETFNVDKPMGADKMKITGPDGKSVRPGSSYRGHRKSVVDIHLEQSGTYQLKMGGDPSYWTSYQLKGDDKKHWLRGVNKLQRQAKLPKGAINAQTIESYANVVTYITLNSPSSDFKTTNKGLEFVPVTHPSDVAQGEKAQFKFIFNGKAQAGVEVEIVREGVRYRNDPNGLKLKSDKKGIVSFTLEQAGRYLLMAEHESEVKNNPQADTVGGQIFLTFEAVLD